MASNDSKTTTDHKTIQEWVEARGGAPATVASTQENGGPGLLRIDFPNSSGSDELKQISWDDFFTAFEDNKLAFLYQEEVKSGDESRFCKFVSR